jgi:hypothetical protein
MDQLTRLHALQLLLRDTGRYHGEIDGDYGPQTRNAVMQALEDGPDTPLTTQDYIDAAGRLGCHPANILAFGEVEAQGAGFYDGYPKILFEPHRFCRLTRGVFSGNHPSVSYQVWGTRPYPGNMEARYEQLLEAVGLDVYAGFAAASYGKFQIMGENHEACGFDNPWTFAFSQAFNELNQLKAFESFIRNDGLLHPLQNGNWVALAKGYNGTAYIKNRYDVRLAQAARKWEIQLEGRA